VDVNKSRDDNNGGGQREKVKRVWQVSRWHCIFHPQLWVENRETCSRRKTKELFSGRQVSKARMLQSEEWRQNPSRSFCVEEPNVDWLFNYRCKPLDNIYGLFGFELSRKFTPLLLHTSLLCGLQCPPHAFLAFASKLPLDNICDVFGLELPRKFTPLLLHPSLLHGLLKALGEIF